MTTDRTLVQQRLKDGTRVSIRAIQSSDEAGSAAFFEALSPPSKHFLFLGGVPRMSAEALRRLCAPREGQDMALVAFEDEHAQRLIGIARYAGATPEDGAEISVAVADEWQHKGLGTLLLQRLVEHARSRGVGRLYSMDAANNSRMRTLARHFGFSERADPADVHQVIYTLEIAPGANAAPKARLQTL
jgi:RimJ/RimL family protein N-acetyltransferase